MEKKTLGAFIAQLRKEKGLTQKSLAELLNVSDKTVSHWECDETSPDISLLPLLAQTLGITVDELLQGEKKTVQPSAEHHYLPPKQESIADKTGSFASRTLNKIKSRMTGDIADRYRYFRMLSLIGTAIAAVVLVSITATNIVAGTVLEYYMTGNMLFLPGIFLFIGSLWTLAVSLGFTLGARFAFYKTLFPSAEADETERKHVYRANLFCFNNIFLVFCSLPMALTGLDALGISVLINIPIVLVFLAVLWLSLVIILNKKAIIRTEKRNLLRIRFLGIFALSFVLVAGSVWFVTEEIWFPRAENLIFDNAEEFRVYMETPKEKPADAFRIDGVSPTISIIDGVIIDQSNEDYIRTEKITVNGQTLSFRWLNKSVYHYAYNNEQKTFHVITYEAKLKQKDQEILADDGVPVFAVIFCIIDAVTCFCLYRKKAKEPEAV